MRLTPVTRPRSPDLAAPHTCMLLAMPHSTFTDVARTYPHVTFTFIDALRSMSLCASTGAHFGFSSMAVVATTTLTPASSRARSLLFSVLPTTSTSCGARVY